MKKELPDNRYWKSEPASLLVVFTIIAMICCVMGLIAWIQYDPDNHNHTPQVEYYQSKSSYDDCMDITMARVAVNMPHTDLLMARDAADSICRKLK